MNGTCKWFNQTKGYGFIVSPDVSKDIFVHYKDIKGERLTEKQKVEFDTKASAKGVQAVNVRVI